MSFDDSGMCRIKNRTPARIRWIVWIRCLWGFFCAIFFHQNVSHIFLQFPWFAPCFLAVLGNLFQSVKRMPLLPKVKAQEEHLMKMFREGIYFHKPGLSFSFPSLSVRIPNPINIKIKKIWKLEKSWKFPSEKKKKVILIWISIESSEVLFLWNHCTLLHE